ncbi:sigma-54-dependent Fis family transcriptional regulator [Marinihelvus fidelis]|uniref:Sigma-54-dependent Fis family transcriptional regulator n=1 Tax=Marinihelvus fidelis TaxID=2613842 RepID=A0A5N0TEM0_9GAMM|nr:sigma-54 dependent transcriptional regulator [Marinihelvus fidelis]KAA9133553.1 sigma-54-dependent Fis family transcriptional regulator [Marinihelvus fidelis]
MASILIVDDETAFAQGIADYLQLEGHDTTVAHDLANAREALSGDTPDLVLLDLMLPDGSGLELFDRFEKSTPKRIIIMTGHTGVKQLIGGLAGDAVTYMKKPIDPPELEGLLNSLDAGGVATTGGKAAQKGRYGLLIGESKPMQVVYTAISKVAPTDSTVFIHGESGTGKELVARMVHRESGREGRFIPVNCGGLNKDLVSSQLFGHEKGSFTGADGAHAGFFEQADNGTLFLDEITEMPMEMQAHLLRVLETGKVLRLGAQKEKRVNARLVAATNRDPRKAVEDGLLREDLYFRLSVFPIELPPLRQRHGDIELLANRFLDELNREHDQKRCLSADALRNLERHGWPGNVRELKHVLHRAWILADGDVVEVPEALDRGLETRVEGIRAGRSIADVEKDLIIATLEQVDGNKKEAAAMLGVSLKTLYNRLKTYEMDDEDD